MELNYCFETFVKTINNSEQLISFKIQTTVISLILAHYLKSDIKYKHKEIIKKPDTYI